MTGANWALGYLGIVAFLFTASNLVCSGELADSSGNVFERIGSLVGFGGCEGVPGWFSFGITLLVALPGLMLLWMLVAPVLAGIAANPIAGIILAVGAVVAGVLAVANIF